MFPCPGSEKTLGSETFFSPFGPREATKMCRMFAVISAKPVPAHRYLKEVDCSLFEQAVRGNQGDGWGIGHYGRGSLKVYRSERAIYEDSRFEELTRDMRSGLFIAHVRKASNPRNLPRRVLISEVNSQPFHDSDLLFAHNGTLFIPDQVAEELGPHKGIVKGVNDSEVLFAYLVRLIEECGEIEEAIKRLEPGIWEIFRRKGSTRPVPYRGLNIMLSDGGALYAYEKYMGDCGQSICNKTPVFELQYRATDAEVIVSSEALTPDRWEPVPNGALLKAEIVNGKPTVEIKRLR